MNKNIKLITLALIGSLQLANVEAFPFCETIPQKNQARIESYKNAEDIYSSFKNAIKENSFPKIATLLACNHINPKLEGCSNSERADLLNQAIKQDNILIVSALLNATNKSKPSAMPVPVFNLNIANEQGVTPLMMAFETQKSEECVNLLIRYGADLTVITKHGTILHSAIKSGEVSCIAKEIFNLVRGRPVSLNEKFFSARDEEKNDVFSLACKGFRNGSISASFFSEILNYFQWYQFARDNIITEEVKHDRVLINELLEIKKLLKEDSWFLKLRKNFQVNDPKTRNEITKKIDNAVQMWQTQGWIKTCYFNHMENKK